MSCVALVFLCMSLEAASHATHRERARLPPLRNVYKPAKSHRLQSSRTIPPCTPITWIRCALYSSDPIKPFAPRSPGENVVQAGVESTLFVRIISATGELVLGILEADVCTISISAKATGVRSRRDHRTVLRCQRCPNNRRRLSGGRRSSPETRWATVFRWHTSSDSWKPKQGTKVSQTPQNDTDPVRRVSLSWYGSERPGRTRVPRGSLSSEPIRSCVPFGKHELEGGRAAGRGRSVIFGIKSSRVSSSKPFCGGAESAPRPG